MHFLYLFRPPGAIITQTVKEHGGSLPTIARRSLYLARGVFFAPRSAETAAIPTVSRTIALSSCLPILPSMSFFNQQAANLSRRIRLLTILLLAINVVTAGCQRREEIASYSVPKLKDRLLAAMVVEKENAWFFKVTGPANLVGPCVDSFRSFVTSLQFADGKPQWELPAGWTEEQSDQASRFATIRTSDAPGALEVTVIPLQISASGSKADDELANVNRWLGQLQLPPIAAAQLEETIERLPTKTGTAIFLDATGVAGNASRQPPFMAGANVPHPPIPEAEPAATPAATESDPLLTYTAPENWQAGRRSMMRKAAFVVNDGEASAEITVIDLARGAGELLPNVNRWRGQVGLDPLDAEQLSKELVEIPLDDVTGQYVEMFGRAEAEPQPQQAILGVIALREDRAWFVKLTGPAALATTEKERFLEFVKSIRFTR